ncbi:MAG: putative lipid II flippase FtsW [Candidatus Omnitrophica bacterium]|nr:putative lipid II flippase FtsW [Candidatus Omnitrophota bacterium]
MNPRKLRQLLFVIVSALLAIGIVAVASASAMASQATYGHTFHFVHHHLASIAVGLLAGLACLAIPYEQLRRAARWLFVLSLLLLALVLLIGPEMGGAKRWVRLGRLSLQPSEFAQLSLVLYLADLLARHSGRLHEIRRGLLPPLAATGLMAGVVLIQPDLGTAIVMGAAAMLLLAIGRARGKHLALIMGVAAVAFVVLVFSEEYRMRRMFAFLDPMKDPRGSGYQILQSYVAMASGGVAGLGVGGSLQKLFYLPSAHADFIFAIIGEELGLLGATAVISLFGLFLACGFRIAMAAHDLFSKYLVCGLVGMIGLEAFINIAVVIGLLPTKGLPLPFISYGGSAMVINLVACALILQASRHGERYALGSALGR